MANHGNAVLVQHARFGESWPLGGCIAQEDLPVEGALLPVGEYLCQGFQTQTQKRRTPASLELESVGLADHLRVKGDDAVTAVQRGAGELNDFPSR